MSNIFDNIPDVSFVDDITLEEEQALMVQDYQNKYKEITGKTDFELSKASPYRAILNALTLHVYQVYMYLDLMGKRNLLKYSTGTFLDDLAVAFGCTRKPGDKAITTERFTLSEARPSVVTIPEGTRVTNGTVYFLTKESAEISIGDLTADIPCECSEAGTAGNGYLPGEINTLVDSIAYIGSVSNTTATDYGTDIEDDDTFRERVYMASGSYSVAGPVGAYEYFCQEYSSLIADVRVTSPTPVAVDIRIILDGGKLPSIEFCEGLKDYLADANRRPLTDQVTVAPPVVKKYNIDAKYFINESEKANVSAIQKAVEESVEGYKTWQDTKIGRDINPDELIHRMVAAGAKRAEVTAPAFTTVQETDIPQAETVSIVYGGLEDD